MEKREFEKNFEHKNRDKRQKELSGKNATKKQTQKRKRKETFVLHLQLFVCFMETQLLKYHFCS